MTRSALTKYSYGIETFEKHRKTGRQLLVQFVSVKCSVISLQQLYSSIVSYRNYSYFNIRFFTDNETMALPDPQLPKRP